MTLIGFNKHIRWNEFKELRAAPAEHSDSSAYTHANRGARYRSQRDPRTGVFSLKNVSIVVSIDRRQSWVVKGEQSAELLAHEQLHYTLSALGGRDLHRTLLKLTATSEEELYEAARTAGDDVSDMVRQANEEYDDESDHSRDVKGQQLWASAIRCVVGNPNGTVQELVSNTAGVCTP